MKRKIFTCKLHMQACKYEMKLTKLTQNLVSITLEVFGTHSSSIDMLPM